MLPGPKLVALPNAFGDAATNMAIDAALLDSLPEGLAVFRHYGWTEPTATFGYAQSFAEIDAALGNSAGLGTSILTLCRRMTGGGIVDHRNDWTYALILRPTMPSAQVPAPTLYERIHLAISETLGDLGLTTKLAPCPRTCAEKTSPTQTSASEVTRCFLSPAANDVLRADGRKLAGAAMKRSRKGLLIQGSLDRDALPESFELDAFQSKLLEALATALQLPISQNADIRRLFDAERVAEEQARFASRAWNQRR